MPSISHAPIKPNPDPRPTILNHNKDYPKWNQETHHLLKKHNFTRLLKDKNKPAPTSHQTHLQKWTNSQKTACALVITNLHPTIAKAMKPHKTLETLLRAIDNYTKPSGEEALEILCCLWTRLSTLSSFRYASISEYCAEARAIESQYRRLGSGMKVSEAVLSCAFLAGLPLSWQEWKIGQTRQRAVIVPWDECASSTFTFENLVNDALVEEEKLYKAALKAEEVKWGFEIRDVCEDEATVVVDFCTVCLGVFHKAGACSGVYSGVRRSRRTVSRSSGHGLKRRRDDSKGRYTHSTSLGASMRLRLGSEVFLFNS